MLYNIIRIMQQDENNQHIQIQTIVTFPFDAMSIKIIIKIKIRNDIVSTHVIGTLSLCQKHTQKQYEIIMSYFSSGIYSPSDLLLAFPV